MPKIKSKRNPFILLVSAGLILFSAVRIGSALLFPARTIIPKPDGNVSETSLLPTAPYIPQYEWPIVLSFSPDSKILAEGPSGISLHDAHTHELIRFIPAEGAITAIAFSPDGLNLASGSSNGIIQLWRVNDGELLHTLVGKKVESWEGSGSAITVLAFAPDGQTLASGSGDGTVRLWRTDDGTPIYILIGYEGDLLLRIISGANSTLRVESIAFSPDGKTLASGADDGVVRLWRASDGELLSVLGEPEGIEAIGMGHNKWVDSIAFSPDGQTLVADIYPAAYVWRLSDNSLIQSFEEYKILSISPDGKFLATDLFANGRDPHDIEIWRIGDGRLMTTLEGHTDDIHSVAFSSDGQLLAASADDNKVNVWELSSGTLLWGIAP